MMQLRRHLGAAPRSTSSDRRCRHVVTACLVAEFLGALGLREVTVAGSDTGAVRRVHAAAAAQARQAGTVRVRLVEIPDSYTLVPLDQPTAFARSACSSQRHGAADGRRPLAASVA